MSRTLLYVHGMGGSAAEAEQFRPLLPDCEVTGVDLPDLTPWGAREPIRAAFQKLRERHDRVELLANSIGAYFSMLALGAEPVEKAYFISPVVDLEELIRGMMAAAGVTEDELRARGDIAAGNATLSWKYLCYVREHPVRWDVPTEIVCAENDQLIPRRTIDAFVSAHHAGLTVMPGGEQWFHTPEQMDFLRQWF
ncbi:MAG: alpha/beta hydrolase, partial [Pyramidobacter sp.]|nr:alpha/beta hydrolase [Pyramidobacter sp.]